MILAIDSTDGRGLNNKVHCQKPATNTALAFHYTVKGVLPVVQYYMYKIKLSNSQQIALLMKVHTKCYHCIQSVFLGNWHVIEEEHKYGHHVFCVNPNYH